VKQDNSQKATTAMLDPKGIFQFMATPFAGDSSLSAAYQTGEPIFLVINLSYRDALNLRSHSQSAEFPE
jgi:hypothetical protein